MTKQEHIEVHKKLHASLDQLVADAIQEGNGGFSPSRMTVMELITWSHQQTIEPSDKQGLYADPEPEEKPV